MRHLFVWMVVVGVSLLLNACGGGRKSTTETKVIAEGGDRSVVRDLVEDTLKGLKMVLFEAPFKESIEARPPIADAKPLSDKETAALLRRIDELPQTAADRKVFAFRKGSAPPPRTGETVKTAFPAIRDVPPPSLGKPGVLEVVRYAPEGDVSMAPHLSVTFSKPMVAVSSQENAAEKVPVVLSPTPAGKWRWLGTQTLLFDPDERFPAATDYRVRIPVGTKAAAGEKMSKAFAFSFSTPPPAIERSYPTTDEPQSLTAKIVMIFNQKIAPETLMPFVELRSKDKVYPVRPAEMDDELNQRLVQDTESDRVLVVTPVAPLPKSTLFDVVLKSGAPSAEGPKTTRKNQTFSFRTFSAFEVEKTRCGWGDTCRPTHPWVIELSNPIELEAFDPDSIVIEPSVPGMEIHAWNRNIRMRGAPNGSTTYKVTLPASLRDTFGQTLGKTATVTFDVGPAEKALFGPPQDMITLDPAGPSALEIHTVNHDAVNVEIQAVAPGDFNAFQEDHRKHRRDKALPLPGKSVFKGTVDIDSRKEALTKTLIDLKPYTKDGFGQFMVRVVPTEPRRTNNPEQLLVWVQVTGLGLTAFVDNDEMVAWTTALKDGRPVADAEVMLLGKSEKRAKSDKSGLSRFTLGGKGADAHTLVARRGADTAILPNSADLQWGGGRWRKMPRKDEVRWFVFDDRGMYRPGETAKVKGWLRRFESGKNGDISALNPMPKQIKWRLFGSRRNELLKGTTSVSRLGGFHLSLDLPKNMNLGRAQLQLEAVAAGKLSRTTWSHPISVQEFRRPEFEVTVTGDPGPFILGEEAFVTAAAHYYAGGTLPLAPVNWNVFASPAHFSPPGRDGYHFGPWSPWWSLFSDPEGDETSHETLSGKTDGSGMHRLGIRFEAMKTPRPMSIRMEGRITDLNRQAWSDSHQALLHPAARYVGVKPGSNFVGKGETVDVDVVVVDLDGADVMGVDAALTFLRLTSVYKKGQYEEAEEEKGKCSIESGEKPARCSFQPDSGGVYLVRAQVKDSKGRLNQTEIRIWVAGAEVPRTDTVDMETVTLIPEKAEYQPGETATFMVQAPFYPAEGVMTVRRSGIVKTERFRMDGPTKVLSVPIEEAFIPNIHVQVDLVGAAERGDDKALPRRPAFASGVIEFKVPPLKRTLDVAVQPDDRVLSPGGKTTLKVSVADAAGKPIKGAELAIVVADESVLALSGYRLPDPIALFYAARQANVLDYHQRRQVVLSDDLREKSAEAVEAGGLSVGQSRHALAAGGGAVYTAEEAAPMGADTAIPPMAQPSAMMDEMSVTADNGGGDNRIAVRSRFDALALFAPEVVTDGKGRAEVSLSLPDSLTRYRIMAVAVGGEKQFGKGESDITARLPLMVRPANPRFLNFGDKFALPVMLQNQTDAPMTVEVALRAGNIALVDTLNSKRTKAGAARSSTRGKRVTVPARDRVEVRFPGTTLEAGIARFQVAVTSGTFSDAQSFELPVWTPATAEAFATYGVIDEGTVVQPIETPKQIFTQFGGLEISTQSTELQSLTDAVLYLVNYPYDCSEQIASRMLAITALKDVLSTFEVEDMPKPAQLKKTVNSDIAALKAIQSNSGGFSFWRRGEQTWPYLTVHVAHALAVAERKGFEVPGRMKDQVIQYLIEIKEHIPEWYTEKSRFAIRAYAVSVLEKMGVKEAAGEAAAILVSEASITALPLEALGWLWPTLKRVGKAAQLKEIKRKVMNSVTETAAGAHFVTSYDDGAHVLLHSERRVDGVLLDALLTVMPSSDLVPKLVRGLLGHREKGRWSSTQENAFVLLALDRYFHLFEKSTPNFVAKAWLGDRLALEHKFMGRTMERAGVDIPMGYVAEEKTSAVTIDKRGKGRLYYRVGMRYAPESLSLTPADYGFALDRTYEAVDNPEDVKRDKDGTWRIRAGARVRVILTMAVPMRRYHVALVDPLPAGVETINPELATTGTLPDNPGAPRQPYWWWYRPWFEHQNMRDERVEAFTSLLWDGVHEYSYLVRATTPGRFVVPPTRAEEMYHPETFGRTGTDRVVVE